MKKYFLIIALFAFFRSAVSADDYYKALQFYNKKKIDESIISFMKVANDENHEKRSDAMFNLALIYDNGFGVQEDKSKALFYYESASQLSNKFALFNLGWMYYNGDNVNKDVFKAFDLYNKASDFGHPRAMFNLANMYFTGVGTVKDIKMAYKLFLKSKMNGIDESKYYIDKISKSLSPEELGSLNNEFSSLIEKKIILTTPVD